MPQEVRALEPGSIWKHNKRGTRYEILSIAGSQIDENETDMVVYQGLDDGGRVWVRPVDRFLEMTSAGIYRFDLVKKSSGAKQIVIKSPLAYNQSTPTLDADEDEIEYDA